MYTFSYADFWLCNNQPNIEQAYTIWLHIWQECFLFPRVYTVCAEFFYIRILYRLLYLIEIVNFTQKSEELTLAMQPW